MKKLLFICSQNRLRSPTAEQIFSTYERLDVRSAGLDKDAISPLLSDDLEWADIFFVMEKSHRNKLSKKFKEYIRGKRVINLNIPDEYECMDPTLIQILKSSVPRHLETY